MKTTYDVFCEQLPKLTNIQIIDLITNYKSQIAEVFFDLLTNERSKRNI